MSSRARRFVVAATTVLLALAAWLVVPLLVAPATVHAGDDERWLQLARFAPADADEVMIVPSGGSLWFSMRRHPIREDLIFGGALRGALLAASVGRNPVILWRRGDKGGAVVGGMLPRRLLLRTVLPAKLRGQVSTKAGALVVGASDGGFAISKYVAIAHEPGELFVAHRDRPSIPGVAVPAISTLALRERELMVTTSMRDVPAGGSPLPAGLRHPRRAIVSVALSSVTSIAGDWERLFPLDAKGMGAGLVAVYGVDSGAVLPRVRGVVVARSDERDPVALLDRLLPAIDGSVSSVRRRGDLVIARREAMGLAGEAAIVDGHALLALDGSSMDLYLDDRATALPAGEGSEWSLRARPAELRTAIGSAGESLGFKILGKGTRNSVKSLSRGLGWLEGAGSVTIERGRGRVVAKVEW